MTALLTASQAASDEERNASARLARSALDRLEQQGTEASEAGPASLAEVAARIRFTVGSGTDEPAVIVACESPEHLLLPGEVVRAVFEATTEAVQNAVRHSGASRCDVTLTGHRAGGTAKVTVSIKDNGTGFDPGLVSDRRLGIRVSIVGRMEAAGGTATVITAPRAGTEVRLSWEGEEA
jgi:signal transduction histidine kinase